MPCVGGIVALGVGVECVGGALVLEAGDLLGFVVGSLPEGSSPAGVRPVVVRPVVVPSASAVSVAVEVAVPVAVAVALSVGVAADECGAPLLWFAFPGGAGSGALTY